ncbi:hypothetical protein DL93DRAFT_2165352 [Clavulina sp. PMI_390]|nr:hypothetical protein DL93DRAFT_2165352 [Clavulina sp. PMI_390]
MTWPTKYRLQAYRFFITWAENIQIQRNRTLENEADIVKALALAEHIKNETLALYSLKKYRHLKRAYPDEAA